MHVIHVITQYSNITTKKSNLSEMQQLSVMAFHTNWLRNKNASNETNETDETNVTENCQKARCV